MHPSADRNPTMSTGDQQDWNNVRMGAQEQHFAVYDELQPPTYNVPPNMHAQYQPMTMENAQTSANQQTATVMIDQAPQSDAPSLPIITDQERFLPISNVAKIMKRRVPDPCKVSKEAKEGVQEASSEFIQFIVSEAVERCQMEKRKTITGDDILLAMTALGFDQYIDALKAYLDKFRLAMRGGAVDDDDAGVNDTSNEMYRSDGGAPQLQQQSTSTSYAVRAPQRANVVDDNQEELVPSGAPQMVSIQMAQPDGTVRHERVPLVSYVDPHTGQTYITLHTNGDGQSSSRPQTVRVVNQNVQPQRGPSQNQ